MCIRDRLKGELGYPVTLGTDTFGNITRLDNALEGLPKRLEMNEMELDNIKKQFETAKVDVERPFPQEEELKDEQNVYGRRKLGFVRILR